jgi:hypothetical protein
MTTTMSVQYVNGDRYVGQVFTNFDGRVLAHGAGTKYFANGDVYNGSFYNDLFHGYGTYKGINGDHYKGTYSQGQKHGQGESYRASDQRTYIGGFNCGVEEGYATITLVDYAAKGGAKKYVGQMKGGRRHGFGKQWLTALDGLEAVFEGQWVNGLLNGPGTQTHPTQCLSGTFVNGVLEGPGTYKNPSTGAFYSVVFQRGMIARYM